MLGYKGILTEGSDQILKASSPNVIYTLPGNQNFKLLTKNFKLSDDIAFRFSDKKWKNYPLTPQKYVNWLEEEFTQKEAQIINIFMDYETFGEHHWKENGIFKFLSETINLMMKKNFNFVTPSMILKEPTNGNIDVENYISWADEEKDISAWAGNSMQTGWNEMLYSLESKIKNTGDERLLHQWRKLTTSDHAYYMSTKSMADGAVHSYFSPFHSPHEAYLTYMNVWHHLKGKLEK